MCVSSRLSRAVTRRDRQQQQRQQLSRDSPNRDRVVSRWAGTATRARCRTSHPTFPGGLLPRDHLVASRLSLGSYGTRFSRVRLAIAAAGCVSLSDELIRGAGVRRGVECVRVSRRRWLWHIARPVLSASLFFPRSNALRTTLRCARRFSPEDGPIDTSIAPVRERLLIFRFPERCSWQNRASVESVSLDSVIISEVRFSTRGGKEIAVADRSETVCGADVFIAPTFRTHL